MSYNSDSASVALAKSDLEKRVKERFGVLPNFFRLTPETPEITEKLWGFASAAYLDNPLPSLFKERLFVYLSRFCAVRYCIARHVGFLTGLGCPAGDPLAHVHTVENVVRLLRREVPRGDELEPYLSVCAKCPAPLAEMPSVNSQIEDAIFALTTHAFLQTGDASICLDSLSRLLGAVRFQYLLLFISFVRAAHYWTKTHPELEFEDDIKNLLASQEVLAACILNDPEANSDAVSQQLLDELPGLRRRNAEILHQSEELRDLSRRLLEVQDQERRHIARELHDSIGQYLAVLKMQFSQIKGLVTENSAASRALLSDTAESIDRCLSEVRTISHLLHPPVLDALGLVSAIQWYADGFSQRSGVKVSMELPQVSSRFPENIELVLFRVLQESLTNVHRHSGSSAVTVQFEEDEKLLRLCVKDNGRGIPEDRIRRFREHGTGFGIGIVGMHERLRELGGQLAINSDASGTILVATVPLNVALSAPATE